MGLDTDERVRTVLGEDGVFDRLEHHVTVGSTNDVALSALRDGQPVGLVVVADRQTAGRGRSGRAWTDDVEGPEGPGNLAVTATVAPPDGPVGLVPLAAGLAVAAAYEDAGAVPELKWPNDVLLGGRKAAGILVERHRVGPRDVLLIGCGLDLDWRGAARSDHAAGWVSLAEVIGGAVDRGGLLASMLRHLRRRLVDVDQEPDWLRRDYVRRCATISSTVRVSVPGGGTVTGIAAGIDDDGRLIIDTGSGRLDVSAGDVTHLRPV